MVDGCSSARSPPSPQTSAAKARGLKANGTKEALIQRLQCRGGHEDEDDNEKEEESLGASGAGKADIAARLSIEAVDANRLDS